MDPKCPKFELPLFDKNATLKQKIETASEQLKDMSEAIEFFQHRSPAIKRARAALKEASHNATLHSDEAEELKDTLYFLWHLIRPFIRDDVFVPVKCGEPIQFKDFVNVTHIPEDRREWLMEQISAFYPAYSYIPTNK
jgi:hypothetical protein